MKPTLNASKLVMDILTKSECMILVGKYHNKIMNNIRNPECKLHPYKTSTFCEPCLCYIFICKECGKYYHDKCGDIENQEPMCALWLCV